MSKKETEAERKRKAFNQTLAESQEGGIRLKIIDNKGYYVVGSLGTGLGAWSRAGRLAQKFGLSQLPKSLTLEEWTQLNAEIHTTPWQW